MSRPSSSRPGIGLAVFLVSSMMFVGNARATTVMVIQGNVNDPVGRALGGVTVTDNQSKSTTTDSLGYYRIEETTLSTYIVTASRTGLNRKSQTVDPTRALTPVDFTLTYILSGSVSPQWFNNEPPKTLTITANSYAPAFGQCVTFTDSPSGSTVALSWQSTASDGSSTWTGSYQVSAGRADGTYSYTISSADCSSSTTLTNTYSSSYRIDSVVPIIDSLAPLDYGNTVSSFQPLLAKITDPGGSGVKASTISFTLTDETDPANIVTTTHPASVYSASTGWAKTAAVSLTLGHVYRISVSAYDNADNAVSAAHAPAAEGGGFLATSIGLHGTKATIPSIKCDLSEINPAAKKTVTCRNVRLDLEATSLTIGGNRHPVLDVAFVEQSVSLDGALLKATVAGLPQSQKAYPGMVHIASMRYDVPENLFSSTTVSVHAKSVNLGTLVTEVEATWTAPVTIDMALTHATASTAACADPSTSSTAVTCVPDPWLHRYVVVLQDDVGDPGAVASNHAESLGAELRYVYSSAIRGYAAYMPLAGVSALRSDSTVGFVARDREFKIAAQTTLPAGVDRINAENKSNTGDGVQVAVLDTGIDLDHPDLAGDMLTSGRVVNCSPSPSPDDIHGHGTHVAGTIAALNNTIGVVGAAPQARLWSIKVLGDGGWGLWANVICGIEVVHLNSPKLKPLDPIRVANMSLGGQGSDDSNCGRSNLDAVHLAICNAASAGVTFAVAAGNSGADVQGFIPSSYDEVMTVSALADSDGKPCGLGPATSYGNDDTFASFSNYATLATDKVHMIAAPGVDIYSTVPGSYGTKSGTSMASPHVAGAASLYLWRYPGSTPGQVLSGLRAMGEPPNVNFNNECSSGGYSHTDPGGSNSEPVLRADAL